MLLQASTKLIATANHDYPEWHRGRCNYGLWYIQINQPELISYLNHLQQQFSDLLITPNIRQYHITLFVAGFLTEKPAHHNDDFEIIQINQQIEKLKALQLSDFDLELSHIDSFSSALFVNISDPQNTLDKIRKTLYQVADEIAAPTYYPHITLGLYREAWPSVLILERIQTLSSQKFKVQVNQLTFGYYNAQILQGLLYPYHQVQLG
ncbi:2'-5' RNA ligase family protein [Acinetobacter haemolyticus]|uniref:2'-5' RNA ligase family protein n=1 Tax=Acinetobacter haemolyticus TaxID=29430 RepID=UPI00148B98C8|nr:2'-5' RNA ligase family protein [Acinetobacter haemolyticus]